MSKTEKILEYLKAKNTITSMEAFAKFNATRLSDVIYRLKRKGYDIRTITCESVDEDGRKITYAKYRLVSG